MALTGTKDATQILAGGAEVKIGAYVAAAVAGSLQSFGHTLSPTELGFSFEDFEVESEQSIGKLITIPVAASYTLKFDIGQNDPEAMLIATRMSSVQLTGAVLGAKTLAFVDPQAIYYQVALIGPGWGSTSHTDTYTFWRCQVSTIDNIPFGKRAVQHLAVTMKILRDDSAGFGTGYLTKGYYGVRVQS